MVGLLFSIPVAKMNPGDMIPPLQSVTKVHSARYGRALFRIVRASRYC
jgi:hypothetical protein